MRLSFLVLFLSISQLHALEIKYTHPTSKNTEVTIFKDSEQRAFSASQRTVDYPTQIIRMSHTKVNQQVDCTQVNQEINKIFLEHMLPDKFSFTGYISCTYDPNTHDAVSFILDAYFDPLNDEAVALLESYLSEYNGTDLFGNKFTIEPATAVIISLSVSAGTKKRPSTPPFVEFRRDHSHFHFKNNYEVKNTLLKDVKEQFLSDQPEHILPFLDKWVFTHAGTIYAAVLRDSDFVLLEPEQIFIMDKGEKIFVPRLKYHFAHSCLEYPNHKCLPEGS